MPRKLKPATVLQRARLDLAITQLASVRKLIAEADCPRTLKKVENAIRSAEGARRHIQRRITHSTDEAP